jgi:type I restriction enzyme S subunit
VRGNRLPWGWTLAKLSDVAHWGSGGTPRRTNAEFFDGEIPWVVIGDLKDGPVADSTTHITERGLQESAAKWVPPGAVLLAMYGSIGKLGIASRPLTTNQAIAFAVANDSMISSKYLFWYLMSARNELRNAGKGGTQRNISQTVLKSFPIPLPPRAEQEAIVEEIEKQFTRLDAAVISLTKVRALLNVHRAALLNEAVRGTLVANECENALLEGRQVETGQELLHRILDERSRWGDSVEASLLGSSRRHAYQRVVTADETGLWELPQGWAWGAWDQIANWVTYGFTRPMPHVDNGIPIVTARHVLSGKIDTSLTDRTTSEAYQALSPKDRPQRGDILITKDGTIGRAAVVGTDEQFCINQSVAVVWLRSCPMDRRYLLAVVEAPFTQRLIRSKARGAAMQHLSITDVARMPVPIPPFAEQQRIGDEIERQLSIIDALSREVGMALRRQGTLRQSVLKSACSGSLISAPTAASPAARVQDE